MRHRLIESRRSRMCLPVRGFTLAELIIALGLTVLLAASIFSAIGIYVRLTSSGQRQVLKAQITRALIRQMQADLSGIVFVVPETEEEEESDDLGLGMEESDTPTDGTSAEAAEAVVESAVTVTDPTTSIATQSIGLVGDANTLLLHVSRPVHPLRLATTQTAIADGLISDEKTVAWFMTGSGTSGYSGLVPVNSPQDGTAPFGLSRMEGDRFAMTLSEEQGADELLSSMTRLLAPEVQSLQFEYFDGMNWLMEWDSTVSGRLPQAVRVTMGLLLDDPGKSVGAFSPVANPAPELVTHVIRIPRAEPYVDEFGL